ncbi:acyl-CoA Delta(11) desaturase-like [Belonocnema kinseyi]|uniref:acyl-CoA Delta(11) desaturase-like n=1 Tax=Belonocnema kinseyi TaxID=2817044 RepID=UPI00143CF8A9|nr:acyl-CoA Delta(11) desaturase-like [Belonocnema kinseyi]
MTSKTETVEKNEAETKVGPFTFKTKPKYMMSIFFLVAHCIGIYAFFTFPYTTHKITVLWMFLVANIAKFGETAGVHRLWAHKAYKANAPLRAFILLCYYTNGGLKAKDWIKLHRCHHKHTDTDADPHNTNRGFFFAHMGWLMLQRHPELRKKVRQIDFSDIEVDPVLTYGDKFYFPLMLMCCVIIPAIVPVYLWNETWRLSLYQVLIRFLTVGHITATVNSVAHYWGSKPYDRSISPVENKTIAILTLGEGWHNYHHIFPWDYKAAELPIYSVNVTTFFIDQFAKLGWAYDLKQPSPELVKRTCLNRGDGTHQVWGQEVAAPEN